MTNLKTWSFFLGLSLLLHLSGAISFAALKPGVQEDPAGKSATSTIDSLEEILGAPQLVSDVEPETVDPPTVADVEKSTNTKEVQEVVTEVTAETVVATNSASEAPIAAVQEAKPETVETLTPAQSEEVKAEELKQSKRQPIEKVVDNRKQPQKKKLKKPAQRSAKPGQSKRNSPGRRSGGGSGSSRASRGAIQNYGARVRSRISANRPGSVGRGRVRISFGISKSGRLRYARIVRSSGNAAVDRAALAAVRRSSPFPKPPAGASLRQLRFAIPFTFQ